MTPLTLKSHDIPKGEKTNVILALVDGVLQPHKATELGMLVYESTESDDEYFYYNHPTNIMAIRTMKATFAAHGYDLKFELETADKQSVAAHMYQREVPYYSVDYIKRFDPDSKTIQAPVAVDKMVVGLIAKHHPRLASAAVLTLIEDYDPEEMKQKIVKNPNKGEVWAYVRRASSTEKKLTGYDFVICLCREIWMKVDMSTKRYMLDHELMHQGRNAETGAWELWQHTVQCFVEEISRYGGKIKEVDAMVAGITQLHKEGRKSRRKSETVE